ncbi:MAG: hypothetical protein BWK78_08345 [Thiotrichaceae bacterium IS1]|nr:MAG: hypothetical protein BWK78_08345 [Thiotrichaceae bacterium IS1]
MFTLTIDNFPPMLHAKLQEVAARNRISLTQQARLFLEYCLTHPPAEIPLVSLTPDPYDSWPRSSLQAKDLNEFLAQLPHLGEDAEAFAEEIQAIRHSLPLEKDSWA